MKKVRIAYEKDNNRRKYLAHKAVHEILNNYDFIAIQDEMVHNWHKGYSEDRSSIQPWASSKRNSGRVQASMS